MVEPIKLDKLLRMVESLKKQGLTENADVTFEYIMASLFPHVMENINDELMRQYTLGYIAAKDEEKEQEKN